MTTISDFMSKATVLLALEAKMKLGSQKILYFNMKTTCKYGIQYSTEYYFA